MEKYNVKLMYRSQEKKRHIELIKDKFFGNDKGYGYFGKDEKRYNFVLEDGINNLYEPIRNEALKYFKGNDIEWWGGNPDYPTGHTVSSQIACLNHLMFLRQKPTEVMELINGLERVEFIKVFPVPCDADISYIAFEAISDKSYLNEPEHIRGSYCTSIDALIYAEDINNEKWIILIEWKYTEAYGDSSKDDKSLEDYEWCKGEHGKGRERMRRYNGLITNRNKFVLGPSGSGKSFFMNHLVRQYYEQGAHVVLVDTGNSYQGLCEMIRRKTGGTDGVYFTYTEEKPISFNPFYTDDYVFDVEKKDSIKTLLLTLWKSEDDKVTKTESGELGSAVSAYIERIRADRSIVPSFNTFYEYMRDDYRRELAERDIKVEKEDFNIDNMLTTMRQYYRGGRYDFLLNSAENIDLLGKRFIVFEIDSIKDNRELFPVVTIIIMEAFINKMRRLKGVRKQLIVEEAWKALSSANMADYLRYMYKTVRKYFGEAIVVTQEVDDIISSPVVKESIINNSDCKILLDQRKYMNKFDQIQALLGLTEKEKSQILSINMANNPSRLYKEVWIGLGGTQSAVYATEVSAEEYLAYTTEETEKVEVYRLAEQLGGDIEAAIRQLAERRRNKK